MNFSPNETPAEVSKGGFGRTYFRDICSGINEKWYKIHGKNSCKNFSMKETATS